jgi:hypothetical protein
MTIPLDPSGLNFRAGLEPGLGLGGVARAFYSVKQLKTAFGPGSGQKNFCRLQDLCPHPSSKVRGWAWRGPGLGWVRPGSKCSSIASIYLGALLACAGLITLLVIIYKGHSPSFRARSQEVLKVVFAGALCYTGLTGEGHRSDRCRL